MKIRTILKTSLVGVCLMLTIATSSHAKEWRGITPFPSTIADVVRQLGSCTSLTNDTCTYSLKEQTVKFVFTSEACGTGKESLARQIIVRIELQPKVASQLPDYHEIDFYHFSAYFVRGDISYIEHYVNDSVGFAAEAKKGIVTHVYYTPIAADIRICPSSYIKPSELLPVPDDSKAAEFLGPDISVTCPDKAIEIEEPIKFFANVTGGNRYLNITFSWTTSAGKIIAGQSSPSILVDTKGLPGDTEVTATLTIGGIPVELNRQAACTSKISPHR